MTTYYAVVQGDPLDNGGNSHVIEGAEHSMIEGPDGRMRMQTHVGQKAWCSVCKSAGIIIPAPNSPHRLRGYDTRLHSEEALGGDLVVCKCAKHPRIVSVYACSVIYVDDSSHCPSTIANLSSSLTPPAHLPVYDEQFTLREHRTGDPLPDIPYRLRTNSGHLVAGITDKNGKTQRITTKSKEKVIIEILA